MSRKFHAVTGRPLRILLSQATIAHIGAEVSARLDGVPHQLVALDALKAGADESIDIAFLTKDVSGASSKTRLSDALAKMFDIVRASASLQWIHTHSAGADRPIYPELMARGVTVSTSSGLNADTVAQSAVTGLMMLARRFNWLADAQHRRAWEPLLEARAPRDLKSQVAVVVGLGPIGLEIARILNAIGLHVIGVRTTATPAPGCNETIAYADLPAVLPRADWLLLACPLTDITKRLVDAPFLARLPRGARIVNVARGEVVVEADLIAALQSGHLAGACLDVFEREPLTADSPLWSMPDVIVTPHTASHASGNARRVDGLFLDNLTCWRERQPLVNDARRYTT